MTERHQDDWISAYLDDELSPDERQQAEERIARDPGLQARLAQIQQLGERLRTLPTHRLPATFAQQIRSQVEAMPAGQSAAVAVKPAKTHPSPGTSGRRASRYVAIGVLGTLAATLLVSLTLPNSLLDRMAPEAAMNSSEDRETAEAMDAAAAIPAPAADSFVEETEAFPSLSAMGDAPSTFGGGGPAGDAEPSSGPAETRSMRPGNFGLGRGGAAAVRSTQGIIDENPTDDASPAGAISDPMSLALTQRAGEREAIAAAEGNLGVAVAESPREMAADSQFYGDERLLELEDIGTDRSSQSDLIAAVFFKQSEWSLQLNDLNGALSNYQFQYQGVVGFDAADPQSSPDLSSPLAVAGGGPAGGVPAINQGQAAANLPEGPAGHAPGGGGGSVGGSGLGGAAKQGPPPNDPNSSSATDGAFVGDVLQHWENQSEPVLLELEGTVAQIEGLLSELATSTELNYYQYSVTDNGREERRFDRAFRSGRYMERKEELDRKLAEMRVAGQPKPQAGRQATSDSNTQSGGQERSAEEDDKDGRPNENPPVGAGPAAVAASSDPDARVDFGEGVEQASDSQPGIFRVVPQDSRLLLLRGLEKQGATDPLNQKRSRLRLEVADRPRAESLGPLPPAKPSIGVTGQANATGGLAPQSLQERLGSEIDGRDNPQPVPATSLSRRVRLYLLVVPSQPPLPADQADEQTPK